MNTNKRFLAKASRSSMWKKVSSRISRGILRSGWWTIRKKNNPCVGVNVNRFIGFLE
jgi:hypothetical protein